MRVRLYTDVRDNLFRLLRAESNKRVSLHHRMSTHVGNGQRQLATFLNVLNSDDFFQSDGVYLTPGEVSVTFNVETFLGAIFEDYKARGWSIQI